RVACVDRRAALGGTCLNIGCIPSQALLDSSEGFALAPTRFAPHGIAVGDVTPHPKAMLPRKDAPVKGLTHRVASLFKKTKLPFVRGRARLGEPGKVVVKAAAGDAVVLEAKAILLATGSEPASLPSLPFDGTAIVSSTEALSFDKVPTHLIVVGA